MSVSNDEKVSSETPAFDVDQKRTVSCLLSERADRIRRRAGAGSLTGMIDGSELSENSNTSSTLNDEGNNSIGTSDVHQKGKDILRDISSGDHRSSLVLNMLRTNENSWPFLEPVTEELAPNYFSIIEVSNASDEMSGKRRSFLRLESNRSFDGPAENPQQSLRE